MPPAGIALRRRPSNDADLFVISPADARLPIRLVIARHGAADGFTDDRAGLCLLALQVQRALLRGRAGRLELGPLVLATARGTLGAAEQVQTLTPDEVRLLAVL